jgi:hypothetical protein
MAALFQRQVARRQGVIRQMLNLLKLAIGIQTKLLVKIQGFILMLRCWFVEPPSHHRTQIQVSQLPAQRPLGPSQLQLGHHHPPQDQGACAWSDVKLIQAQFTQ